LLVERGATARLLLLYTARPSFARNGRRGRIMRKSRSTA
jgi:hypothetical protein